MRESTMRMLCPYRVLTEEHKAMAVGTGDCTTQSFYFCELDVCAAYHDGKCMRAQETICKAADVAPVRHGAWIEHESGELICSCCGIVQEDDPYRTKYCPDCGAKMDGKENSSC